MKNNNRTARLALLVLMLFLAQLTVMTVAAQTPDTSSWIKVSPAGENFTVLMPQLPVVSSQKKKAKQLNLKARTYTVTTPQKSIYTVWSLSELDTSDLTVEKVEEYLDSCIEIIWDEVQKTKPAGRDEEKAEYYGMQYVDRLELDDSFPGREYVIRQGDKSGLARIFYAGSQVYIITAMNVSLAATKDGRKFINSFALTSPATFLPLANPLIDPLPPQVIAEEVYSPRQVTQKARILSRPEPQYTEEARKFRVSGTVILRAVFSADGQLRGIKVFQRLPHGVTQTAIKAARAMRFQPALKDGKPVSQYIQIEYNYNLY